MIPEKLKNFIEQNCSGKEPSEIIMEAIGNKIEEYGANPDEVLAFVDECAKGPTLEQKVAEAKHKAEVEAERLARIEEAKAKVESDAKNAEIAADKAKAEIAAAERVRAQADVLKEERDKAEKIAIARKSKRRTYIVAIITVLILGGASIGAYLKIMTGKSAAKLASEAAYNYVNNESIDDIEVSTADVPSDDPSVTIDPKGDVKEQLQSHYDTVFELEGGFYKLKDNNLYGLADASGKIIQRPKYDEIFSKNNLGLIKVTKDGKMGYLNLKGVQVVEPKYTNIGDPIDGMMKTEIDGKYGFLEAKTLREVTPCKYSYIYSKENGKFKILDGDKEGYLNEDGSVAQEPK